MTTYFLLPDGTGGMTPDGTLPSGAVECTQDQQQNAQRWTISNGAIVAVDTTVMDAAVAWSAYKVTAQAALDCSDVTVLRCMENAIVIPADWVAYRVALRAIVSAATGDATVALPAKPAYPVGS